MSLSNNIVRSAFALVVAISAAACGDDAPAGSECGAGTTLSNGECVADAECGAGTQAQRATALVGGFIAVRIAGRRAPLTIVAVFVILMAITTITLLTRPAGVIVTARLSRWWAIQPSAKQRAARA